MGVIDITVLRDDHSTGKATITRRIATEERDSSGGYTPCGCNRSGSFRA
jgi:hypothetical protein